MQKSKNSGVFLCSLVSCVLMNEAGCPVNSAWQPPTLSSLDLQRSHFRMMMIVVMMTMNKHYVLVGEKELKIYIWGSLPRALPWSF